ncbi:hypothetical protein LIER_20745 [Lithospermum erythrorhizon]|uniref:Uncharacterized protein n=1 Tax=Lithospermum erythrorhizon TaxID=34254 RepID=A0AAV3QMN3_LITER
MIGETMDSIQEETVDDIQERRKVRAAKRRREIAAKRGGNGFQAVGKLYLYLNEINMKHEFRITLIMYKSELNKRNTYSAVIRSLQQQIFHEA